MGNPPDSVSENGKGGVRSSYDGRSLRVECHGFGRGFPPAWDILRPKGLNVEIPVGMRRRKIHRLCGLPPAGLDVLQDVDHVVSILLVGEFATPGIDEPGVARLPGGRPVT